MHQCPYCKKTDSLNKSGFNRNRTQRYYCRSCNKYFTPKGKRCGEKEKNLARGLYFMGFSLRHIAKQLEVHHHTIKMWLTPEMRLLKEQVTQLTLEGKSLGDIFNCLNKFPYRNSCALWHSLRIADPLYVKEYIRLLHKEGKKLSEICRIVCVSSEHAVQRYLKD